MFDPLRLLHTVGAGATLSSRSLLVRFWRERRTILRAPETPPCPLFRTNVLTCSEANSGHGGVPPKRVTSRRLLTDPGTESQRTQWCAFDGDSSRTGRQIGGTEDRCSESKRTTDGGRSAADVALSQRGYRKLGRTPGNETIAFRYRRTNADFPRLMNAEHSHHCVRCSRSDKRPPGRQCRSSAIHERSGSKLHRILYLN